MSFEQLEHKALQLSEAQRAELATKLLESLSPAFSDGNVDEALLLKELHRRGDEMAVDEHKRIAADDALKRVRALLK